MKILLGFVLFVLMSSTVLASLGTYEPGQTVTFAVICLTNEGHKDDGCTGAGSGILDPDDSAFKSPTNALAEVSDSVAPGLWRGDYLIPSGDTKDGTWSVFLNLTNSNSTSASGILSFQVVNESFDSIGSDTAAILVDTNDIETDLNDGVALTSATETQIDNIEGDTNELQTNQGSWLTATGFSTHSAADVDSTLSGTHGAGSWATATGFSTHSATDVWSVATRALTGFGFTIGLNSTALIDIDTKLNASHSVGNWSSFGISANEVWAVGTREITGGTIDTVNDKTGYSLTLQDWLTDLNADNNFTEIATNFTKVHLDLDNPDQYKADVSALSTSVQVISVNDTLKNINDSIFEHGDTDWITATGFSTHSADDVWSVGTRTLTVADWLTDVNAYNNFTEIASNFTIVMLDLDDTGQYKATGFLTDLNAANNFSGIASNFTAVMLDLDNPDQYKATDFLSDSDAANNFSDIASNFTAVILDLNNPSQYKATGFLTDGNAAANFSDIALNFTESHSDLDRILAVTELRRAYVEDASASTTKFTTSLTEATTDYWTRAAMLFTSGSNAGQIRAVKKFTGATKEITLQTPLNTSPANGDNFTIVVARKFLTPDVAEMADAVWDENATDHTDVGTYGGNLNANISGLSLEIVSVNDTLKSVNTTLAETVWTYASRTLTSFAFTIGLNTTAISDIWDSATRTITSFAFNVGINTTAIDDIDTRLNASHSVGNWSVDGIAASDVWSVATRDITGGSIDTVNDKTGYELTTQDWLTDTNAYNNFTEVASNFTQSFLDLISLNDTIKSVNSTSAESIWLYSIRTITSFAFDVGLNSTAINDIDTMINATHGDGTYDSTLTSEQNATLYDIVDDVDLRMNTTHGIGAFGSALDSTQNITLYGIAKDVWSQIMGGGESANETVTQINETVTWIEQRG